MTTLASAIRAKLEDRQLTANEIDSLLSTADGRRNDGVDAQEMRSLLGAIDASEHGLTPALRAQLLIRLGDMGGRSRAALGLLQERELQGGEVAQLAELQHRVSFAIDSAVSAQRTLGWLDWKMRRLADAEALEQGRLEPANGDRFSDDWQKLMRELRENRSAAAQRMDAFRARIEEIPLDQRQNAFASLDRNARRNLQALAEPVDAKYLIGASDAERRSLTGELPVTGLETPDEPTEGVAGLAFQNPAGWSFRDGVIHLEPDTALVSLPPGGDLRIAGDGVILPDRTVLRAGELLVRNGEALLAADARVEVGGVPVRATEDGARARGSNATFIAGPHAILDLPEVDLYGRTAEELDAVELGDAETTPELPALSKRVVRFTAQETDLPDGSSIRRGTGRLVVMFDGARAVGVLEGTTTIDPGSQLYTQTGRHGPDVELIDRVGARGTLHEGAVVYRDGALVGVQSGARATLDGLELSVDLEDRLAMTPYRYEGENRYVLGAGSRVLGAPSGPTQISGEDIELALDGIATRVVSGGVLANDGVVTQVLPNSVIETRFGLIRTGDAMVTIAVDEALTDAGPNAVYLGPDLVVARGEGFSVSGNEPQHLLTGGSDPTYVSRDARVEVRLDGGAVRLDRHPGVLNRPEGLRAFDIEGAVEIASGPLRWSSRAPNGATVDAPGRGGELVWIEHQGDTHELDPRPVHTTLDPATDSGRFRTLRPLMSERFVDADRPLADQILSGERVLAEGEAEGPALLHAVQQTLSYYLDRPLEDTRRLDGPTVEALRIFQRFSELDPTGELDANTLRTLDDVAPPLSQPTVERIQSGPFAGEVAAHVEGILSGIADPMRYRQGFPNPKGPLVSTVQRLVGASPVDGIMGPGTRGRIETWQRSNGAPVTGAIDATTLRRMLDVTGSTVQRTIQPRPKLMVMIAMNNEVPDEFRRFRELAALHGATPVIIGPWDEELQDGRELARYLAQAEAGAVDLDWLVISGHSTGRSTWGQLGRFEYSWFDEWKDRFPRAFAQIEKLSLLNCYNVTPERARNYWPSVFPNLQAAAGFMYSAPGLKSQTSDEFLLNSGAMMAELARGDEVPAWQASSVARSFERDDIIKHQNAAIFIRTAEDPDGEFGMTVTARREMTQHGAEEELRSIPERLTQAYDNYFAAETAEFAHPPGGHNSELRQYLSAVQHIVDRWEGRMQAYRRFIADEERYLERHRADYVAENGSDEGYSRPSRDAYPASLRARAEEYSSAYSWENDYAEVQELRARILNLIKASAIQQQFATFNRPTIEAFNVYVSDAYAANPDWGEPTLLPNPEDWEHLTRQQMLETVDAVQETLRVIPTPSDPNAFNTLEWLVMAERDPSDLELTTPRGFLSRVERFVGALEPEFIQPEWLDDALFRRDVLTHQAARAEFRLPAPEAEPPESGSGMADSAEPQPEAARG